MRHLCTAVFLSILGLGTGCYQHSTIDRDRLDDALASCPRGEVDGVLIRSTTQVEVDPAAAMTDQPRWAKFCEGEWQSAIPAERSEITLRRHVPAGTAMIVFGSVLAGFGLMALGFLLFPAV